MKTINNNMKEIVYELPPNGRCLKCYKQLKIVDNKKTLYKGIPIWVYHDMLRVEIRCRDCAIVYIDKKIA